MRQLGRQCRPGYIAKKFRPIQAMRLPGRSPSGSFCAWLQGEQISLRREASAIGELSPCAEAGGASLTSASWEADLKETRPATTSPGPGRMKHRDTHRQAYRCAWASPFSGWHQRPRVRSPWLL
jgi:hypothetical protein